MRRTICGYLLLTILLLLYAEKSWGQCSCKSTNNSYTTLPSGGVNYFSGVSYNTYIKLTTSAGNAYTISVSGCSNPNVYITVTSGSASGPIVACGNISLSFIATTSTYFVHYFSNSSCGGTLGTGCGGKLTFSLVSVLPVGIISFTGKAQEQGNELHWITATESNNNYFEVESSTDGSNYRTVGTLKGAGTSEKQQEYYFTDPVWEEIMYYRLKQVDYNGKGTYQSPITVMRQRKLNMLVSPNPVVKTIRIGLDIINSGKHSFTFLNTLGKSLEKIVFLPEGSNWVEFDISEELPEGFYILKISDSNGMILNVDKFIKK